MHLGQMRVGYKRDTIDPAEDGLPGGIVLYLSRDSIDLDLYSEAAIAGNEEGQEIEKDSSIIRYRAS